MQYVSFYKKTEGVIFMSKNKEWESTSKKSLDKPAGVSLVKSVGCAGCWAAKSVSLTRACWIKTVPSLAI